MDSEGRRITRLWAAFSLVLMILAMPAYAQQDSQTAFWKGKLEVRQFNFSYAVGVRNQHHVVRSVDVWKTNYDFYQNSAGIVREELTFINHNRSVGGPVDIRLLNYAEGVGLVFDKGRPEAIEGSLKPPVQGKSLGVKHVLGFSCEGLEFEWKTFQHASVQLQSWRAVNSSLRVPLLQVEYFSDNTGALIALTVRVVSLVEASPTLPPSLFQPPEGLRIVHVPMVQ